MSRSRNPEQLTGALVFASLAERNLCWITMNRQFDVLADPALLAMSGLLVAAFSGGPSEDDVKVSRAGLEVLLSAL